MTTPTKESKKQEKRQKFCTGPLKLLLSKEEREQLKKKEEFEKAYAKLQTEHLDKLLTLAPKAEPLLAKAAKIKEEAPDDYAAGLKKLEPLPGLIGTRVTALEKEVEAFNKEAKRAMDKEIALPGLLEAPDSAPPDKLKKIEEYNEAYRALRNLRQTADALGAQQRDYKGATEDLTTAADGFEELAKVSAEVIERQRKRNAAMKKLVEFKACQDLDTSIKVLRQDLATRHGVDPAAIKQIDTARSPEEKLLDTLTLKLAEESSGLDDFEQYAKVLLTYEAKFKLLRPKLVEVEKKYQNALASAPKKPPTKFKADDLPDFFQKEVAAAGLKAKEVEGKEKERAEFAAEMDRFQKNYAAVGKALENLLALGGPDVLKEHEDYKKRFTIKKNWTAVKPTDKPQPTKPDLVKGADDLDFLCSLIDSKREGIEKERLVIQKQLLVDYEKAKTAIREARKKSAEGVDGNYFDGLLERVKELKPLLTSCKNDGALTHLQEQLAALTKAANDFKAGGPGEKAQADMADKMKRLKERLDEADVKAHCPDTRDALDKERAALAKDLKTKGPNDPGVLKTYETLNRRVTQLARDAADVGAKKEIYESDLALTRTLLAQTLPAAKEAAKLALSEGAGNWVKALALQGDAWFDEKYLTARIDAAGTALPSESLAAYDQALAALRQFRIELSKQDFKKVLADMKKRQEDEQSAALLKERWEREHKDFKGGLFDEARSTLENVLERIASKVLRKKREQRVKTLEALTENAERIAKSGDYTAALASLDQAKKFANQIIDFPEGSKPPGKGDYKALGQRWVAAVDALQKGIGQLCDKIRVAKTEIPEKDPTKAKFADLAEQAAVAYEEFAAQFDPKDFDHAFKVLEGDDETKHKAAKEQALQIMRKYRRVIDGDPLWLKLVENPFTGVNAPVVLYALGNIDLVVQIA